MIPTSWTKIYRDDDYELLGFLVPDSGDDTMCVPVTVFGSSLSAPVARDTAAALLHSLGLEYLLGNWELVAPDNTANVTVRIIEASPDRVVVQHVDFGDPERYGIHYTLETPTEERLRRVR